MQPRILANLPEAITLADQTAIYVSSVRTQDFTLEGAIEGSDAQLTANVPQQIRLAIARRFEIQKVTVIGDDHPVAERFRVQVTWDIGE
jgi:hypothetical protein